jgi:uncharacterized membrane protein
MRLFGHPVHPILVSFPVALLALTPVWDAMAFAGVLADAKTVGYFCEVAGLIISGLAIVAGVADFMKIPASEKAAVQTGLIHAGLALGVVSLFGVALALRGGRSAAPGLPVLAIEAAGALCLGATGWFGGHLVFRHGVGVRPPTP